MRKTPSWKKSFLTDDRGTVAILFSFSTIVLLIIVGVAIESARYHNFDSKLQDSLDAAALVGAKMLPDNSINDDEIIAITRANFASSVESLGITAKQLGAIDVTIDRANSAVVVKADFKVASLFGTLAGGDNKVNVERTSRVVYDIHPVELAMVLDITGSMNDKNKLHDLQQASKDVIDTMFKDAIGEDNVRIAVAPYSASVNAGALADAVSTAPPVTTCSHWYFGRSCTTAAGDNIDSCVIERNGGNAATDAAPVGADKLPAVPYTPYGRYSCPPATVLPLLGKSQAATIKATIDGYTADGATAGHIGTAWGWYLLSPSWGGVLPAASKPAPYNGNNLTKAALIMTDGLFNTAYINGENEATQTDDSYARFQDLCSGMKAKGIKVYTVGFDLADARAISELQTCSSGASYFFDAKTGSELKKAFQDVAKQLTQLRLAS